MALGAWWCAAAAWPASPLAIGKTSVLWQPLLVLSLLAWTAGRARRIGWAAAAGQSVFLYAVVTLAAWLPWLHATAAASEEYPYPRVYGYYLWLYEAALAALVGWLGWGALAWREPSWWTVGGWSRPLAMAPAWLIVRAVSMGHWLIPLVGVSAGALLGAWRPWRRLTRPSPAAWGRLAPWALGMVALLAVVGSGLRIYQQTGPDNYLLASDDGRTYYDYAVALARDPGRLWRPPPFEVNFFTLYPVVMSWWFRLAGAHLPSWLIWQGVASGVLALAVYWLGRQLASRTTGLIAAGLVSIDHVMLHLMGTLNMEVFFIPALYVAIALWASAGDPARPSRWSRAFLAGLMVGVATLMRPTSALVPWLWLVLLRVERPTRRWAEICAHGGWLLAGFLLPMAALMVRHHMVWGQPWGADQGSVLSWQFNYAWDVHGQHPGRVGWDPWLRALAADPAVIWREMIPEWWAQVLFLWTHRGFGQMDLLQGLNHGGFYQAALTGFLSAGILIGILQALRRRRRGELALLSLPLYFTGLALVWYVLNSRYRSPFLPALYLFACLGIRAAASAIRARVSASSPARPPPPAAKPVLQAIT